MVLIRHNKLKPPFDNYEELSLSEPDALAEGRVNPNIQDITSLDAAAPQIIEALRNAKRVVCSESIRTQQTAQQLMNLIGIQHNIEIDARLNEIVFTPSKMLPFNTEEPLKEIRTGLYRHIQEGGGYADSKEVLEEKFLELLKEYNNSNTACFSHGFLMRLLVSYVKQGVDMDKALKGVYEEASIKYLSFIEV